MAAGRSELEFVAKLRDDASRAAKGLKRTLTSIGGRTRAVETDVVVRDKASKPLAGVRREIGQVNQAFAGVKAWALESAVGRAVSGASRSLSSGVRHAQGFRSSVNAALDGVRTRAMESAVGRGIASVRDSFMAGIRHANEYRVRVNAALDGVRTRIIGVGTAATRYLGRGALVGAIALGYLGAAGGKAGVTTAASMEQAQIAFTTMLGSAQKSEAFLKDLAAFAAKTPFEFPELQSAASSLISAGIEARKVIPIMTTLGNVTSGMGTGSEGVKRATIALQQMTAAGRITGEDLNQLRDAGIPVFDLLAAATGRSKAEVVALAQAGKLGAKELGQLMEALESGKGLERFSGLMDKQSQSLSGLWSTFKDTLGMGLAKLLEPAIPAMKRGLGTITTLVDHTFQGITAFVKGVSTGAEVGTRGLMTTISRVGAEVGNVVRVFVGGSDSIAGEAQSTFTRLAATIRSTVSTIVSTAAPMIIRLGGLVRTGLLPAWTQTFAFLTAHGIPVFQSIADIAIGTVLPAVVALAQGFRESAMPVLESAATLLREHLLPAMAGVASFIAGAVVPVVVRVAHAIGGGMRAAIEHVTNALRKHEPQLKKAAGAVAAVARVALAVLGPALSWLAAHALPLVGRAISLAITVISKIVGAVEAFGRAATTVGGIAKTAFNGILQVAGNMAAFVLRHVISPIIDGFLTFASVLVNAAATAFGWVPGLGGKLKKARSALDEFRQTTSSTLDGLADDADAAGEAIGDHLGQGVVRGIREQIGAVAAESQRMAHAARAAAARELMIASPSKAFERLGRFTGQGLVRGLHAEEAHAAAAAARLAQRVEAAARPSPQMLATLADASARDVLRTVTRHEHVVTIRHEVNFRGDAPAGVTAEDVAAVLSGDPNAAAKVESTLKRARTRDTSRDIAPSR